MRYPRARLVLDCGLLLAAFVLLLVLGWNALPSVGRGTFRIDRGPASPADLPLELNREATRIDVAFPLFVPFLVPHRALVVADDCIEELKIDDVAVTDPAARVCDYQNGRVLDLSPLLHRGRNEIKATVHNVGGRSGLDVSVRQDYQSVALAMALLLVAGGAAFRVMRFRRAGRGQMHLLAVFLGGSALRVLYVLSTRPALRGHDTDQHLDYGHYTTAHWHPPPAHAGFEFYQPPLYYVLTALVLRLDALRDTLHNEALFHLQLVSLGLSMLALGAALWVVHKELAASAEQVLCASLIAVFPGLVFFSARINNDVLVQFTDFAAIALLVLFCRGTRTGAWVGFSACVGVGLLAKSNALVLVAIGVGCVALRRGISLPRRAKLVALLAAIMGLIAGWFEVGRALEERRASKFLVSNTSSLSSKLVLPNSLDALFWIHPLEMLRHPYNHPWDDSVGRRLWEYFVRSSLFGEFDFGERLLPLCQILLALLAVLACIGVRGWWRSLRTRSREDLPMHLVLGFSLASQLAFRILSAFSPSQDFRYSFLLALPCAVFVARGLRGPYPWWQWPRWAALTVCWSFVGGCALFLVALWVVGAGA
jgi:hypothetical protein